MHAAQREPADVRRRIEVGDQRLQRHRRVVHRRGDALHEQVEQRPQIGVLGQARAVGRALGEARPSRATQYTIGKSSWSTAASRSRNSSSTSCTTSAMRASARSTLLTTRITGRWDSSALRSTKRGLGQRALGRVDEQQHTIDHRQAPLHLATEVRVAGRVDDVDLHLVGAVAVPDRGVLGEDRDALLALEVHRVHHAVGERLVRGERAGLAQHLVDERRLAVVDVGDDGDVADVVAAGGGAGGGRGHGDRRAYGWAA